MASMFLCVLFGCTQEQLSNDLSKKKGKVKPDQTIPVITDMGDHCVYTHLIAGQHHIAGSVTVDVVGDNLVITYTANGDWTLGTTHLSIGNCDEDWAPLTGSGNPQIGHFEYTVPFSWSPNEVIYHVPLAGLNNNYCFAAHAEVQGPTGGETAWAQGPQFAGNGWAMFVESNLSDCPPTDDGGGTNGPT